MSDDNIYFAADTSDKTVKMLDEKARDWFTGVSDSSYLSKIERSWSAYYGDYFNDEGHTITYGGESGEIVNLAVNHFRNLARHIHVMVTGTRPAFQCRAINGDNKSLIQAKLGNGLLDYYMRELRLEEVLKDAVEYAIVLGSGYIKIEWNSTKGKIYDYVEPEPSSIVDYDEDGNPLDENGKILKSLPIYEGNISASLLSPYDVIFDSNKPYFDKNDWVVCRSTVNKYDLAAKYPEYAEKILKVETVDQSQKSRTTSTFSKRHQSDDIFIKEFYHKRTEAVLNGRYILYINHEIILEDTMLPYRSLPIYRITPSSIIGTPYGYTDMFDLLPMQEFLNSMYSTAATNINAFGVQSILSPREAGVEFEQVGNGMQFIKYNAQSGGKPEPMQLTATSQEVYQMMGLLEKAMETISGVNSVARGNPEQSLRSGNALALVQSQALQFVSGLRSSYNRLLEDVGSSILYLLQDFAAVPRVAAIAGINNKTEMKSFKSEDIRLIDRVFVDEANALMNTTAGRTQIAENLLQMGLIDNVDKYLMVLNTGNLDQLTDGKIDNLTLIKSENEAMLKGEVQQAIWSERHSMHIKEHMELLNDSELKKDTTLVQLVLDHVQEHVNLLRTTDPTILSYVGEQPAPPAPTAENVGEQGTQPRGGMTLDQSSAVLTQPQNPIPSDLPEPAEAAGVSEGLLPPQPTSPEQL